MAKDAFPSLIPLLILTVLFGAYGSKATAIVFLILSLFIAFFFRDPERKIPDDPSVVVSPADGKVVEILQLADGTTRISIFLSIFNVHINRAPVDGIIESTQYSPGKFKPAFDSSASAENEQNVLVIDHGSYKIRVSQIAGILARRIVCWKKTGESVQKGERFGLIKFGSRVDLTLPVNVIPSVKMGDRVKGGSTVMGRAVNAQG
jgi:phosphatidylserine decarboxylase